MSQRIDTLKRSGYKIIQEKERFCFGIDAVLIANFAKANRGEEVFDLGTGTGIIPLLMSYDTNARHFTALEVQEQSAEMARQSVELNNLQERISIVHGDVCNTRDLFDSRVCEVVVTNPPYMTIEQGKTSPNDARSIARTEILCDLRDVVGAASYLLKPCGRFYMIHRPNRLSEIFSLCKEFKMEPKRMQLIYPYVDKPATMVMIEARKDARPDLIVEEPLIVYSEPGVYSEQVQCIYDGN